MRSDKKVQGLYLDWNVRLMTGINEADLPMQIVLKKNLRNQHNSQLLAWGGKDKGICCLKEGKREGHTLSVISDSRT